MTTTHKRLAEVVVGAARYLTDIAPHTTLRDYSDPAGWYDQRRLAGQRHQFSLHGEELPRGWEVVRAIDGAQFVATAPRAESVPDAIVPGADDVPEMLDLARRTKPVRSDRASSRWAR